MTNVPLLDHCSLWNVYEVFCTRFVRIKDSFSPVRNAALPPHTLPVSFPQTLASLPALSVLKRASICPPSLGAHSLTSPLSLRLETLVLCDVESDTHACPSSTPAVQLHAPKLQSSCGDAGAASEDDSRWRRGRASTGGCVQRSGLLSRRVPGVHPFMDVMRSLCFFFFSCFSFVHPGAN